MHSLSSQVYFLSISSGVAYKDIKIVLCSIHMYITTIMIVCVWGEGFLPNPGPISLKNIQESVDFTLLLLHKSFIAVDLIYAKS